ncbi:MAG: 2,3-bisphosphoglycerate-dependent phosphoglycerate mutase [Parachlamydiales bacterium]|jgi:2,3-bisphosphoglycerate-dependent phosphoglycerate mutase
MQPMLILMRHGESIWNQKNLFTGWVDVPLSEKGVQEAIKSGEKLRDLPIQAAFTSTLMRAQMTLFLALLNHSSGKVPVLLHEKGKLRSWARIYSEKTRENIIPVFASWHLNERMYGKLQGLNKEEVKRQHGETLFKKWRRSFDTAPPSGESLKMTKKRTIPYFRQRVMPFLKKNQNVLISAHGNSLRSIVMEIEQLGKEEVVALEMPLGSPLFYEYRNGLFVKKGA